MNTLTIIKSSIARQLRLVTSVLFLIVSGDTSCLQKMNADYGKQIILVSNSQGMDNGYERIVNTNTHLLDKNNGDKKDVIEDTYNFESAISVAKSMLSEYFGSAEYRKKLENEIKIEKYSGSDLNLHDFEKMVTGIVLTDEENSRINTLILERLSRLKSVPIVPVSQVAFFDKGEFVPDLEGLVSGFYYASEITGGTHYMGVKLKSGDKGFVKPTFGAVYVLNLFGLSEEFGTPQSKYDQIVSVLIHELGGHGVMDYDKGFTKGSELIYAMMTDKWRNTDFETYLGDKSEMQSRMLEYRSTLFLLGVIPSISSPIEESHIARLIAHYKKNGDEISLKLLSAYERSVLRNVMNGITMNEKLSELERSIGVAA